VQAGTQPSRSILVRRDVLLIALTLAAGAADAVSFLGLGEVFTANQTGNAVLLGLAIGQVEGAAAERALVSLVGFSVGAVVGAVITRGQAGGGDPWPRSTSWVLAVEAAVLGAVALAWTLIGEPSSAVTKDLLLAMLAAAMGLQSVAAARVGISAVSTTFVTGTLTTAIMRTVARCFGRHRSNQAVTRGAVLLALVFAVYIVGAILGAAVENASEDGSRWPPFVIVTIVVLLGAYGHRLPWLRDGRS
jgi:uncharacterized membrane protein YoaK (UPF0700 family)